MPALGRDAAMVTLTRWPRRAAVFRNVFMTVDWYGYMTHCSAPVAAAMFHARRSSV